MNGDQRRRTPVRVLLRRQLRAGLRDVCPRCRGRLGSTGGPSVMAVTRDVLVCAFCVAGERQDAELVPIRCWPVPRRDHKRPVPPGTAGPATVAELLGERRAGS